MSPLGKPNAKLALNANEAASESACESIQPPGNAENMPSKSCFENYDSTFKAYDDFRRPVGLTHVLTAFARQETPLHEQAILEGGCGTASFLTALAPYVRRATGIDASTTGLQKARTKLSTSGNTSVHAGNILRLDHGLLPDASVHSYMVNHVLHHLDAPASTFPNLTLFRNEAARVLRLDGILTVLTTSQEQLDPRSGVLHTYRYVEARARELASRTAPVPKLVARIEAGGQFRHVDTVAVKELLFDASYFRPRVMLDAAFHACDSVYAGIHPQEVDDMRECLEADIESGAYDAHLKQCRRRFDDIGMCTLVVFQRVAA